MRIKGKSGLLKNPGFPFFVGKKGDFYGIQNNYSYVPGSVHSCRAGLFVCPQPEKVKWKGDCMAREHFEQRLLRIFKDAGYLPSDLLSISPEEMVEVPGVTVPNIRAILTLQGAVDKEQAMRRLIRSAYEEGEI